MRGDVGGARRAPVRRGGRWPAGPGRSAAGSRRWSRRRRGPRARPATSRAPARSRPAAPRGRPARGVSTGRSAGRTRRSGRRRAAARSSRTAAFASSARASIHSCISPSTLAIDGTVQPGGMTVATTRTNAPAGLGQRADEGDAQVDRAVGVAERVGADDDRHRRSSSVDQVRPRSRVAAASAGGPTGSRTRAPRRATGRTTRTCTSAGRTGCRGRPRSASTGVTG